MKNNNFKANVNSLFIKHNVINFLIFAKRGDLVDGD